MHFVVNPSAAGDATVSVPGDKSISHRSLMFAAIADGESRVHGFLAGEDCLSTMAALEAMGVAVTKTSDGGLLVKGKGLQGLRAANSALDLGNSGTGMRLFAGLLAGQAFDTVLTGDASLSSRPMGRVIDPLSSMGARIASVDGRPPLTIEGGHSLTGIDYALPVASAQVKSAVLLAGLYASGETVVHEPAVTRDHTERMLRAMGADIKSDGGTIRLTPGATLQSIDITVPADLSSATFPMVAALIARKSRVRLENVGINPTRDGVLTILRSMGADIRVSNERQCGDEPVADIEVRSSRLSAGTPDKALVPLAIDEFPALFVAAACADGVSEFRGLAELRVKESDRLAAMATGLAALGIQVEEFPDGIRIHGGEFAGGAVDSHGDHRIAMAFAVAGSVAGGPVTVQNVAAVDTSFPGFATTMQGMGLDIITGDDAPVITIDGPSGSGKGTIARRVSRALGWELLDSGALYRLVGLAASRAGVDMEDQGKIAELAARLPVRFGADDDGEEQIWLDDEEVSREIRSEDAGRQASIVAAMPPVREALLGLQRRFRATPGLVADGRDMGTQVFPDAPLKVYLTASAEERAQRRYKQLKDKGLGGSLAALSRDIEDRDRRDSERSVAPLRPADDARVLDSSDLTIDEVCETILAWAEDCLPAK